MRNFIFLLFVVVVIRACSDAVDKTVLKNINVVLNVPTEQTINEGESIKVGINGIDNNGGSPILIMENGLEGSSFTNNTNGTGEKGIISAVHVKTFVAGNALLVWKNGDLLKAVQYARDEYRAQLFLEH